MKRLASLRRAGRGRLTAIVAITAVVAVIAVASPALLAQFRSGHAVQIDPALALDVTGTTGTHGVVTLDTVQQIAPTAVISVRTITVKNLARAYVVVAPPRQTTPLPLLVVLGGVDASVTLEMQRDELLPLVTQRQAVLVYPVGYGESWNVGVEGCCKQAAAAGLDDAAFVAAVTRAVTQAEPIIPTQIHLVGFSNGGKLAFQIVCDQPTLFADLAIISAVPLAACTNRTQPPVSILIAVGLTDDDLPMTGAAEPVTTVFPPALATWRQRNGCSAESSEQLLAPATITSWSSCSGGTVVVGITYAGQGHVWPVSAEVGTKAAAATMVWSFVSGRLGRGTAT